jgi:hypothetical protein
MFDESPGSGEPHPYLRDPAGWLVGFRSGADGVIASKHTSAGGLVTGPVPSARQHRALFQLEQPVRRLLASVTTEWISPPPVRTRRRGIYGSDESTTRGASEARLLRTMAPPNV